MIMGVEDLIFILIECNFVRLRGVLWVDEWYRVNS